MQNGYYQATGAMVTQFEKLNITANNLANVNTQGYKRESVVIGDFERLFQKRRDELALENHTKEAAKFFHRTLNRVPNIVEKTIDFSQGVLKYTGNSLDVALKDRGLFYAVKTPQGIRLTQQSSFELNDKGELVTGDGFKVMGADFLKSQQEAIRITKQGKINISDDGTVYVGREKMGRLFIGRVHHLKALHKEGDKLYSVANIEENLKQVKQGSLVKQGYIQMSNVNAVREMTDLIETNRLVEMYQKVMTAQMDELNRDAITKIATPRA